jgi:PAS domain S-box-containing protein
MEVINWNLSLYLRLRVSYDRLHIMFVPGPARASVLQELQALKQRVAQLEHELGPGGNESYIAESYFLTLVDAAPVMAWISGPDTGCTFFNRAWLEFRGRTLQQELGDAWGDSIHPEDRDHRLTSYLKSFTIRLPFRQHYRLRRADGEYRQIEESAVPRFDQAGVFLGYMGVAQDVQDARKALRTPDEATIRTVFSLTERERQVLVLIAEGKSTKEAAVKLGISYKTADSHRSRILEKLGVHETASMVRLAIRAGLVEP